LPSRITSNVSVGSMCRLRGGPNTLRKACT
jgi:hypothetical protein